MTERQEAELKKWLSLFGECKYADKERLYAEFMAGRQGVIDTRESTERHRKEMATKAQESA